MRTVKHCAGWSAGLLLLAMMFPMPGAIGTAYGQGAAEPASYGVVVTSLGGDAEYEKLQVGTKCGTCAPPNGDGRGNIMARGPDGEPSGGPCPDCRGGR